MGRMNLSLGLGMGTLGRKGSSPLIPVALLDNFTDANGTLIQNHIMDSGTIWILLQGTGQIQTNQLQSETSGTALVCVGDGLHSDGAASLDVTLPASGQVSAGLVVRATDANTFYAVVFQNDGSGLNLQIVQFGGLI